MSLSAEDIKKSVDILRRHGAVRIVLFGSAVDSPGTAHDLDLAVEGIEGWEFFRVAAEIEKQLNVALDLIPLSPPSRFTRYIERKGQVVYERR